MTYKPFTLLVSKCLLKIIGCNPTIASCINQKCYSFRYQISVATEQIPNNKMLSLCEMCLLSFARVRLWNLECPKTRWLPMGELSHTQLQHILFQHTHICKQFNNELMLNSMVAFTDDEANASKSSKTTALKRDGRKRNISKAKSCEQYDMYIATISKQPKHAVHNY